MVFGCCHEASSFEVLSFPRWLEPRKPPKQAYFNEIGPFWWFLGVAMRRGTRKPREQVLRFLGFREEHHQNKPISMK